MRWKGGRRSSNVDDRRGQGVRHNVAGSASGLLSFIPMLLRTKTGRIMLLVGDFAQASIIAHEVGHHVQTLLGISKQVRQLRLSVSEGGSPNILRYYIDK